MTEKPNVFDIVLDTHNFAREQIDALYHSQLLLKSHTIHAPSAIFPDYVELSCYRLYQRAKIPAGLRPLSRYKITYSAKIFPIVFSLIETMTAVHSNGAVLRQLSPKNVYISREIRILCLFLHIPTEQLRVQCPQVFTQQQFDFACYADDFSQDFYQFRQFLAFPSDLRVCQKIRFTICCDLMQLGACIYEICTGQKIPDAFNAQNEQELQIQRNQVISTLKGLNFPDSFTIVLVKLLFFFKDDFFVAANEVHAAFSDVYAYISNKQIPRVGGQFTDFQQCLRKKMPYNDNISKTIIDHFAKAVSYAQLRERNFDSYNIDLAAILSTSIVSQKTALVPAVYLQQNIDVDGDIYAADKQGRFAVLQGYFGSGKTYILLEVRDGLAHHLQCIGFYIPGAKSDQLDLIKSGFLGLNSEIRNFYHYLVVYICQGITDCRSEILKVKFQQLFNQQKEINLVWSIVPGFAYYLELGEPLYIQVTVDLVKELLYNIIKQLLTCCLLLLIEIDDIQSNIYENEVRVLLDLIKKFPRILVLTTEVPGIRIDNSAFYIIQATETSETYYTRQVFSALQEYIEYQQQEEKQAMIKSTARQQQLTYADVASIYSGSISDNTSISTTLDSFEIRTKCFAFSAASRRGIENCFVAVNYLSSDQIGYHLKECFGQQQLEIVMTIVRKTYGSLKIINKLLYQLYQHSGVLQNYQFVNRTLELLQCESIFGVYQYMKQQQKDHQISKRDICVLSACSLLQPIFNANIVQLMLQINGNEVQSSMSNISAQTNILSPGLYNCSLKDEEYGSKGQFQVDTQYRVSVTDQIYMWQSLLFYNLFGENFKLKYSYELMKCLVYLLDKFYMTMSYLEDRKQLLKFCYIPAVDKNRTQSTMQTLINDIVLLFSLPSREISQKSSLFHLVTRYTQPKLVHDLVHKQKLNIMQAVANIPKSDIVCYFDGTFVPAELLAQIFCCCQQVFTDLFDLLEIAKIEFFLLQQSLYYGQIPQIYSIFITAIKQHIAEIGRQFETMQIPKYIDVNGYDGQSVIYVSQLIDVVNENQQNASFQTLLNTFQCYEIVKKYSARVNDFSILQARCSNFYLLTALDLRMISPTHCRIRAINQLIDQLVLAQQYTLAAQLATSVFTQLNYSRHSTIGDNYREVQKRNGKILDCILNEQTGNLIKYRLQTPLSQTEFELHYLVFKFINLLILTNNPSFALNIAQSLVENSYQSKLMSRYTVFAIHFMMLYLPLNEDSTEQKRALQLKFIFELLECVANQDVYPLALVLQLVGVELHRPVHDNLIINKILTKSFIWLYKKPNLTIESIVTISMLYLALFDLENYQYLANLSKQLLQTSIYINTDSLSQFALAIALACKSRIANERLRIDNLDILRDYSLLGIISSVCVAAASYDIQYLQSINLRGFYCITLIMISVRSKILLKNGMCRSDTMIQIIDQLQDYFGVDIRTNRIQLRIAELLGANSNDVKRLK